MFITETYAKEYIKQYVEENIKKFVNKKIVIVTVCEQGINLLELLRKNGVEPVAFVDVNENVLGKKICGIPVIDYEDIEEDMYVIVSSSTTAYYDSEKIINMGHSKDEVLPIYPEIIEYFREGFEEIDRIQYSGYTKEQNDIYAKEEMRGAIEVKSLPTMLIVDLTTRCNLNCRHCEAHHNVQVSKIRNREENYLKTSRYKQILDYANTIYLNISGEPLMSKQFWEILDYIDASPNDPNLFTVTNGILLNEKAAERIVNSKFKEIYISMDAATNLTYKRLRGGDFDIWKKNVKYLADYRTKQNSKLKIYLQHTISREALEETVAAVKLADELGADTILLRPLYTDIAGKDTWIVPMDEERTYFYPQQDVKYYPHTVKRVIDEVKELMKTVKVEVSISDRFEANLNLEMNDFPYPCSIDEFKELQKKNVEYLSVQELEEVPEEAKNFKLCDGPWILAMIFTNGNIMYCNRMAQAEGNLNFSSIYDLRNSKAVRDIRKGLVENDLAWHCYYCSGCSRSDYAKHLKREIHYFDRGTVLDFNIDNTENLKDIKYTGLSRIQRDGTWNNLDESEIVMYINKDKSDYEISINAEAFVIPGLVDEQRVKVYFNDNYIKELVYNTSNEVVNKICLENAIIKEDNKLVIKLVYENGISPLSLGLGRDDRNRALFIHNIEIK